MECDFIEKLPSAEEYNHLRQLVGWDGYEPEVIIRALPQTLYCVCALMNGTIIGLIEFRTRPTATDIPTVQG